jgi:antitoxin VapB
MGRFDGYVDPLYILFVYTEDVVGTEFDAKVFRSGNSMAVRLPKSLGLQEGDVMRISREHDQIVVRSLPRKNDRVDLTGIYGTIPHMVRPPIDENPRDWPR